MFADEIRIQCNHPEYLPACSSPVQSSIGDNRRLIAAFSVEGDRCLVSSRFLFKRFELNKEERRSSWKSTNRDGQLFWNLWGFVKWRRPLRTSLSCICTTLPYTNPNGWTKSIDFRLEILTKDRQILSAVHLSCPDLKQSLKISTFENLSIWAAREGWWYPQDATSSANTHNL